MARKSSSRKHSPVRATPRSSHGYAEGDMGRRTGSAKQATSAPEPKTTPTQARRHGE